MRGNAGTPRSLPATGNLMKRADLEKHLGKKIEGRMKREETPDRYAGASGALVDKREQRRRDQAAGLVPFAVKLDQALVAALQAQAAARAMPLADLVDEVLRKGLAKE
jgi:hypothetical protein